MKDFLNRPKILKKNEKREYLLQCDEKLALVYFSQFFGNVEILEPKSLRNLMKEKFLEGYKIY